MGFFSWNCRCCQNSIRSRASTRTESRWMEEVVVLTPNGDRLSGEYDGYGRVNDRSVGDSAAMYHRVCWLLSGKPEFEAPSGNARDQGYFVGNFDPAVPQTLEDCAKLKKRAQRKVAAERRKYEKYKATQRAEYLARGEEPPAWL